MINKNEVKHIASLARIGLTDEEIDKLSVDLSSILDWIEQLKVIDIEDVETVSHVVGLSNITREDRIDEFENKKDIVELFPEKKDNYDKVKSVL